jgi:hypothetical protein
MNGSSDMCDCFFHHLSKTWRKIFIGTLGLLEMRSLRFEFQETNCFYMHEYTYRMPSKKRDPDRITQVIYVMYLNKAAKMVLTVPRFERSISISRPSVSTD